MKLSSHLQSLKPRHSDQVSDILVGHGPNLWDFLNLIDGMKRMDILPVRDDCLGQYQADAGESVQEFARCQVQVNQNSSLTPRNRLIKRGGSCLLRFRGNYSNWCVSSWRASRNTAANKAARVAAINTVKAIFRG